MKVEHAFTMIARCPMNNLQDVYEVTFRMDKVLPVERILGHIGGLVGVKLFQEEITQSLADTFECEVETTGVHSNVKTRVVCEPQPVPNKHEDEEPCEHQGSEFMAATCGRCGGTGWRKKAK